MFETLFRDREALNIEIKASFLLAWPLVLGQMSSLGMNVIDTYLAGMHDRTTLAAIGVGAPTWSLVILLCIGLLMAVPPSVAQLDGADQREQVGPLFRQALWLAVMLGVLLSLLVLLMVPLLGVFIEPAIMPGVRGFLLGIAPGAPAMAVFFCCRYLSEGLSWTIPTMLVGFLGLIVLLPLGYVLMFGFWVVPEMGAAGLGIATSITLWLQAILFARYLSRTRRFQDLNLFAHFERPDWNVIGELLRIGGPMGIAIFMEGSLFVATAWVIASMGEVPIAAHQIAILIASLCFMVPLGMAMATTVRVGRAHGARDPRRVRLAAAAGMGLGMLNQTLAAILLAFFGAQIAALFTDDAPTIALAATLMIFAAFFQYADGVQVISNGALRGLKDTRIPMVMTVIAYWCIGFPVGALLALRTSLGPAGMWIGLIVGLSTAAVLLFVRFQRMSGRDFRPM